MSPADACWLSEPDGTLLSRGTAYLHATPQGEEVLVTDVDQPGRLVHRCLIGPVQSVWLSFHDGRCLPAQVERVYFDPHLGRTCVLRLDAASMLTAKVLPPRPRVLAPDQVAAIHAVMRLCVQDDLDAGISPGYRLHCDACQRLRPMPGFLYYAPRFLCTACATAYEVAQAQGLVRSASQFVPDKP